MNELNMTSPHPQAQPAAITMQSKHSLTLQAASVQGWRLEGMLAARFLQGFSSAGRSKFVSLIAAFAVLGIALSVAALITVLSVMNGFQQEVQARMLDNVPHIDLSTDHAWDAQELSLLQQKLKTHPLIVATSPYSQHQSLMLRGDIVKGVLVRGVDATQPNVLDQRDLIKPASAWAALMAEVSPSALPQAILGVDLAKQLGVDVGDVVTLLTPTDAAAEGANSASDATASPTTSLPRFVRLSVVGVLSTGHFGFDATTVLMHRPVAQNLFGLQGATGLSVRLKDATQARQVAFELQEALPQPLWIKDWTRQDRHWFAAVQQQKGMMAIILTLIVAIACFNLVSSLVMTVTQKKGDIAILRTLGLAPQGVMRVFLLQGLCLGSIGTALGVGLGLLLALNLDVIVPALEHALGTTFLQRDIYLIDHIPSRVLASDVVPIAGVSLLLALLATLYPSWRASQLPPAESLKYE